MKWRRSIVRVALAVGAYLLVGMFLLRTLQGRLVYFPSRSIDVDPHTLGRPFEDVMISAGDGAELSAWYFPLHPGSVTANDRVVLVCHGNAGNISHRLDLAQVLLEAGASVLLFDYRGYGRSTGSPDEEGTCRDAQAAYRWLRQKGFATSNIVAYGESLGGGVASELGMREALGGLILQSTFTSIPDVGAEVYPWLPVRLISSIKYETLRKLPQLRIPVLIMHSRQDRLIGFHHAEANFAAAHAPKFFCEISGDHNDGLYANREKILKAVKDFLAALPSDGLR